MGMSVFQIAAGSVNAKRDMAGSVILIYGIEIKLQ